MKLLLIEDDPIWQAKLQQLLFEINLTNITVCDSVPKARQYLSESIPEIIIADILLGDGLVFELFENEVFKQIPFIFVTNSENVELYIKAMQLPDATFLVKPFHALSLQAAIHKVMLHHKKKLEPQPKGLNVKGIYNEKVYLKANDIVFIRSEWNYCVIKTKNNQFALKISLKKVMETLGDDLMQIHRTYLVNKNYFLKANLQKMEVQTEIDVLPIGRHYKQNVIDYLNITRKL